MPAFAPLEQRLWAKVDRRSPNECWPWLAKALRDGGYGCIKVGRRLVGAHRVAWSLANNRPVPEGMYVCHSCDNPPCCNPAHLWLGTNAENLRDAHQKGRSKASRHILQERCKRGHEFTPENTYAWKSKRRCRACNRIASATLRMRKKAAFIGFALAMGRL